MKRRVPMKRGASLRRVAFKKKRKVNPERKDYANVHARSGGQCEVRAPVMAVQFGVRLLTRCPLPRMRGVHHLVRRSRGGKGRGAEWMMDICAWHHELADTSSLETQTRRDGAPPVLGRLFIRPRTFEGRMFYCPTRSVEAHRAVMLTAHDWVSA